MHSLLHMKCCTYNSQQPQSVFQSATSHSVRTIAKERLLSRTPPSIVALGPPSAPLSPRPAPMELVFSSTITRCLAAQTRETTPAQTAAQQSYGTTSPILCLPKAVSNSSPKKSQAAPSSTPSVCKSSMKLSGGLQACSNGTTR